MRGQSIPLVREVIQEKRENHFPSKKQLV